MVHIAFWVTTNLSPFYGGTGRIGIMFYRSAVIILKTQSEFNVVHDYIVGRTVLSFLLSMQRNMALQNQND
jgi:hypothetical protein